MKQKSTSDKRLTRNQLIALLTSSAMLTLQLPVYYYIYTDQAVITRANARNITSIEDSQNAYSCIYGGCMALALCNLITGLIRIFYKTYRSLEWKDAEEEQIAENTPETCFRTMQNLTPWTVKSEAETDSGEQLNHSDTLPLPMATETSQSVPARPVTLGAQPPGKSREMALVILPSVDNLPNFLVRVQLRLLVGGSQRPLKMYFAIKRSALTGYYANHIDEHAVKMAFYEFLCRENAMTVKQHELYVLHATSVPEASRSWYENLQYVNTQDYPTFWDDPEPQPDLREGHVYPHVLAVVVFIYRPGRAVY